MCEFLIRLQKGGGGVCDAVLVLRMRESACSRQQSSSLNFKGKACVTIEHFRGHAPFKIHTSTVAEYYMLGKTSNTDIEG